MIKSASYKKGVVVSTLLNIFSKGIGFLNTLIIIFYFGVNAGTDIYFYILAVAALITGSINGIDYLVLVPESMKIRKQQSETAAQKFINFFIYSYIAIGLVLALLSTIAPVVFYTLFSSYDIHQLNSHVSLLYLGSLLIVFQLINNLLSAILTSYKFFSAAIIPGLITSIFSILFTVFFHQKLGMAGTLLGVAIGYGVGFFMLIFSLKRFQNWNFFNVQFLRDKTVWKNIGLMQLNILPIWLRNYFTIYFLTGMSAGIITSFNLAQMLAALPEILILSQAAAVAGIKLSELAAEKDMDQTNTLFINLLKSLFIIIIPIALIMAIANKEIIEVVFERGSFDNKAIPITAFCFFYFAILLPSKIFDLIFTRLFTAFQLYGISTLFAVIAHTILTALLYFFTVYFKLTGFFMALLIGYYIILPITFLGIIKYKIAGINLQVVIKDTVLLFAVAAVTYFPANYLFQILEINRILKIILLGIIVFVPFIFMANLLLDLKYQKQLVISLFTKAVNFKTV